MHIQTPGPVTGRITLLGRPESCLYLVDGGKESALLGGSMAYVVPDLMAQVRDMGINPERITRLVIHHTHFDHMGLVPFLKGQWPWLTVTATERGKAQLSRPDVVKAVVSLNRMLLPAEANLFSKEVTASLDAALERSAVEVDRTVADGQTLRCGDLDLEILEVPGHSSCSMAVYIPAEKALSASDAGGIPYGGRVFAAANSNFDLYQESLEKMAALGARVHLSEHYGALTGDAGRGFMQRSMADAAAMRTLLETTWARYRDEQQTVDAMMAEVEAEAGGYFLPREVMAMVLGQMVRFMARTKGGKTPADAGKNGKTGKTDRDGAEKVSPAGEKRVKDDRDT